MGKKGINLGSWLNPEGYILGGRNIPYHKFENKFKNIYGDKELIFLNKKFQENYITENDFKILSEWGVEIIRLPIHFKFIEPFPYQYSEENLFFFKNIFSLASKYKLKIILDLHAACGSQNPDWHSDSTGLSYLWQYESNRDRTYKLWELLVTYFKNEESLYAYDILNEPIIETENEPLLLNFYDNIIKIIRKHDKDRIIYLEGNIYSQKIDFLDNYLENTKHNNIGISVHTYAPLNFTYNFIKGYHYPGIIDNEYWDINKIYKYLEPYKKFKDKNNVDIFVGEFGINPRNNTFGEINYLEDILKVYQDYDFSWTYWTYKAIANDIFPDGIMQYLQNPPWVCREGKYYGIETLYKEWANNKEQIIQSWDTKNFTENQCVSKVLKKYFNKK